MSPLPTDPQVLLSDLFGQVQDSLRKRGLWPQDMGITDAIRAATSVSDMMSIVEIGLHKNQIITQGAGYDKMNTPSQHAYTERRARFIGAEEGTRIAAYDDATGKPVAAAPAVKGNVTIGTGFNMERPDAPRIFAALFGADHDTFTAIKSGKKNLTREQTRQLFDYTVGESERIVSSKLSGVPLVEAQRLALVSMTFNSPSLLGPKLIDAVKRRDWDSVRDEILYRSGTAKNPALASRRFREANLFFGADSASRLPKVTDYLANIHGNQRTR